MLSNSELQIPCYIGGYLPMPTMAIGSGWLWSSIVSSGLLMEEILKEGRTRGLHIQYAGNSAGRKQNCPYRLEGILIMVKTPPVAPGE